MTNHATALCPASGSELETLRPLLAAAAPVLRLAVSDAEPMAGAAPVRPAFRNPDLAASLRQARVARFGDRYAWLALRRRRAQIAARHALQG